MDPDAVFRDAIKQLDAAYVHIDYANNELTRLAKQLLGDDLPPSMTVPNIALEVAARNCTTMVDFIGSWRYAVKNGRTEPEKSTVNCLALRLDGRERATTTLARTWRMMHYGE